MRTNCMNEAEEDEAADATWPRLKILATRPRWPRGFDIPGSGTSEATTIYDMMIHTSNRPVYSFMNVYECSLSVAHFASISELEPLRVAVD